MSLSNATLATMAITCFVTMNYAAFPDVLDLHDFTTDQGIVFMGVEDGVGFGCQVATGDLNGDGRPDLMLSAAGVVFVIFGGSEMMESRRIDVSTLSSPDGFIIISSAHVGLGGFLVSGFDFNGDGIDDLAVSSGAADWPGGISQGVLYVLFGTPAIGESGIVDLDALDPQGGFRVVGRHSFDFLGSSSSCTWRTLPDYNNDGFSDLVVSASGADAPGKPDAGQTYIIFGGKDIASSGVFDLNSIDGNNGLIVNGPFAGSRIGDVNVIGDVNGDGISEMTWGLVQLDALGREEAGHTYVLFGGAHANEDGFINIEDIPGKYGFVIYGPTAFYGNGIVQYLGDVNGDGVNDIYTKGAASRPPHVVFGGPHLNNLMYLDLAALDGDNGFVVSDNPSSELFCAPGDVDGDGFADLAKIQLFAFVDGRRAAGRSFIGYSGTDVGANGIFLFPSDPNEEDWFEVWGAKAQQQAQVSQRLPDINGDGIDEFVVQADIPQADGSSGEGGYIVFGQRRFAQGDFDEDRDVDLKDFADFVFCFNGPDQPRASTCSIGARADFDRDGDVDLSDFATFALNFTGSH